MGFQWVSDRKRVPFLVVNAENAFELSNVPLLEGGDHGAILTNSSLVVDALQRDIHEEIGRPEPSGFQLLGSRVPPDAVAGVGGLAIQVAPRSSLVKRVRLTRPRVFHRYSAYNPDRRVDPTTGSLLPGTYAVPESEVPFIPTGFAAVGRLALPNVRPASFHYEVEAPTGTFVWFGTVAPAFRQAGGGVEAFFPSGAVNQRPPGGASAIADE